MVWSVGATCDKDGHDKFDAYFRELVSGKSEKFGPVPEAVGKVDCPMPPEGLIYDYLFEVAPPISAPRSSNCIHCCSSPFQHKGRGKWTGWLELIKDKSADPHAKRLSDIIVPTMDTAR